MSLLRATARVGALTLVSRVLGFARDIVLARLFGASGIMDAFLVAFRIPNLFRRLFAEGAFALAFVPVLSDYKMRADHAQVRTLVDQVAGTLGLLLFAVSFAGVLAAPLFVFVFAPGFADDAGKFALASELLRITFPYLMFISLTAAASGVLNSYGRFALPAATPILLNLCLLAAALVFAPWFDAPVEALAWGVLAAGIVQLAVQLPALHRLGLLPRPRWAWRAPGVRRILRLMIPALFGSSVAQINLLLDTLIASFLVTGSVSWLYYSDRLLEFPLGILGIALATVILPHLSQQHAAADPQRFSATLDWALRWAILIGAPAALGLILLSGPLIATLFGHGAFTAHDVSMARLSLSALALGLLGFLCIKVLAPGYYARQDTRTPVRIGIIALIANMGFNALYVLPWLAMDAPGPHAGLALATATSAYLNAGLLWRGLRRAGIYLPAPGWRIFLLRIAAGCIVMGLVLSQTPPLATWLALPGTDRAGQLLLWLLAGGGLYFLTLRLAGLRPATMLAKL